jgi:hypothetical protein
VSGKPFTHFGMFMGSVVIDDGMDRLSLRHPRFDGVEGTPDGGVVSCFA